MNRIRARAFAFFVAALLAYPASAIAAPQVLVPAETNKPAKAFPLTKSTAVPVTFNASVLRTMAAGAEAEITLPDSSRQRYILDRIVDHGGGLYSWIARGADGGDSVRAIITNGPGGSWGWVKTGAAEFRVYPDHGNDWLVEMAPGIRYWPPVLPGGDAIPAPPDDESTVASRRGVATVLPSAARIDAFGETTVVPEPSYQVDVMLVYTKDLANKVGVGLMPMMYNLIATANQAYVESNIAIALRLVYTTMVDYANAHGSLDTLNGMSGSGPFAANFAAVRTLRDVVGADVVTLLRDGPGDVGGMAYLLLNPSPGVLVETNAYSIANFCASGCETIFTHEVGHNMGAHHDRATVAFDNNGIISGGTYPYSYGHYSCLYGLTCDPFVAKNCGPVRPVCAVRPVAGGTTDPNDFGTVMSYFGPIVRKFSAPGLFCNPAGGVPLGRPCGVTDLADNVHSINNVRSNVAAYRSETVAALPGSLQFTNVAFAGSEASGTLAFTVSRIGGVSGAVSVHYVVTGSSATAAVDFVAANGTLEWADGDGTAKTINVSLANDGLGEGIESLVAALFDPAGATGVHLGFPDQATGLILEAWPPGGTFPARWTIPTASVTPWGVASDSSNDSDGKSLKSGPFGGTQTGSSRVQFAGNFVAGKVAFSYRVSSYPGFGFLEFLIDGNEILAASGDSGWKFFTTDITPGPHTLEWRYRKVLNFACATASPPPPQGAACADRSWIDTVSLPLALPSSTTTLTSSLNPAHIGQLVTFTATVTGGDGTPTGTVDFYDGPTPIPGCNAVVLVAGAAPCATFALALGEHSITAEYQGDSKNAGSVSPVLIETITVVPVLAPALQAAVSRKAHGPAGLYDLPLSLAPTSPTTEPRIGPGVTIVLTFDKAISSASASVSQGNAVAGAPSISGSDVSVPLTGVANAQYVTLSLTNVTGTGGGAGGIGTVRIGFLAGDVNGTRSVTPSDLVSVNAVLAQAVSAANYLRDVNLSGNLTPSDLLAVNANLTRVLPPPGP